MTFNQLNLIPQLLSNVKKSGYTSPTPIQQQTIPLVLEGKDVLGCAQTGTGKTAAFALPVLQNMTKETNAKRGANAGFVPRVIRTLVLTPTRELAQQIYENFVLYSKGLPIKSTVIFGGVNQVPQVQSLHSGADVVIACPGRLCDLINQGYVRLDFVETFILDEADRMLDMGFIHDVKKIAALIPQKRQTLLFSATMPDEVEQLAMEMLKNPVTVKVDPVNSTVDKIDQCLYYVDKVNKKLLLAYLLNQKNSDGSYVITNALVFSRTRHGADKIVKDLDKAGIDSVSIHGDKTQFARQSALNQFKEGKVRVLIATDIAARGLDIAGISHVINYDIPQESESYIHRIGRTGRAGQPGKAISFCCIDEIKLLGQVEKLIKKNIREEKSPYPMEVMTPSEKKPRPQVIDENNLPKKLDKNGNPVRTKKSAPRVSTKKVTTAQLNMESKGKNRGVITLTKDGKVKPEEKKIHVDTHSVNTHRVDNSSLGKPVMRKNKGKGR